MKEVFEAGVKEAITLREDYLNNVRSVKGEKHAAMAELAIAVYQQSRVMVSLMRLTEAPESFREIAGTILTSTQTEILRSAGEALGIGPDEVKAMLISAEGLLTSVENNISHKLGLS